MSFIKRFYLGLLLTIFGLTLTILLINQLNHKNEVTLTSELNNMSVARQQAFKKEMSDLWRLMYAYKGLFLASNKVDQTEFNDFSRLMIQSNPEIIRMMWWSTADQASPTLALNYSDKAVLNRNDTLALDYASELPNLIIDTDSIYTLNNLKDHENKKLFGLVLSVIKQDKLVGYLVAEINIDQFIESSFQHFLQNIKMGLDVTVYTLKNNQLDTLLYFHASRTRSENENIEIPTTVGKWDNTQDLEVGNQTWRILFSPTEKLISERLAFPLLYFIFGIVLSTLLASFIQILANRKQQIEEEVENRTVELSVSESRIRSIVDTVLDGIITTNEKGIIESFNPAATKLFGYSPKEVIGQKLQILIPPVHAVRHDEYLEQFDSPRTKNVIGHVREVTARHKDGSIFSIELSIAEMMLDGRRHYTSIIRDITERNALQKKLNSQRKILNISWQGTNQYMMDASIELVASYFLNELLQHTQNQFGFVAEVLFDEDEKPVLHPHASVDITAENKYQNCADQCIQIENVDSLIGDVIHSGQAIVKTNLDHRSISVGMANVCPLIHSFIGVPIFYAEKLVGIYILTNTEEAIEDDILELLQPFTTSYGAIINAKRVALREQVMQDELVEERNKAEEASHAKSEFLSRMSHELRTPLNAIVGFAQLLEMNVEEEHKEHLGYILKAGQHLTRLINEILDIARIEAGHQTVNFETLNVHESIDDNWNIIQPLATKRDITFIDNTAKTPDLSVLADHQYLNQTLLNLLSNAVKYNSENGQIIVDSEITDNNFIRIQIQDTGNGIKAEDVHKVFEPFNRLEAEQTEVEGTGIGLALTKTLVEAMGGQIGVESKPGKGATFWFELQRIEEEQTEHSAPSIQPDNESTTSSQSNSDKKTVLYVEDNIANLNLVEAIMTHQPHINLISAMNGRLGIELATSNSPDLILLDINLPELNGDEVLKRLKSMPETQGIPVIVASADATQRQIENMLGLGAYAYLTKPFDIKELIAKVNEALELS